MNPVVITHALHDAGHRPTRYGDMTFAVCPACWTHQPSGARDLLIWPDITGTNCDIVCLNPACRTNNPDTTALAHDITAYLHGDRAPARLDDIHVWVTKTIGVDAMARATRTPRTTPADNVTPATPPRITPPRTPRIAA